jgi:hypothetical protein
MPIWLPYLAALLLIAGTFLLIRGLRGRRIDDHPLCRRCGFDLIGLPADVKNCSECGADVSSPRAIRIGHRKRRAGLASLGAVLIAPVVLGVALLAYMSASNVKWIERAPYWFVARQSRSTVASERDAALTELIRRIHANQLSAQQVKPLTDAALAAQADLSIPWSVGWGDIIEAAHGAGKLPDDDWKQYLVRIPMYTIATRPEVRRGDDLPVRTSQMPARSGRGGLAYAWTEVSIDDGSDLISPQERVQLRGRNGSAGITATMGGGSSLHVMLLDQKAAAAAPLGTKHLRLSIKIGVYDNQAAGSSGTTPPLATRTDHLAATWTLVAADAPTIKLVERPGARAAVEKSIKISDLSAGGRGGGGGGGRNAWVTMSMSFDNPPVPLAHKIYLRSKDGSREWPITGIYVKGNASHGWGTGGDANDFDEDVVDVIFRPDAKTALNTIEMTEYWNGEAVVPDVKVKWTSPKPATKPTGPITTATKPTPRRAN